MKTTAARGEHKDLENKTTLNATNKRSNLHQKRKNLAHHFRGNREVGVINAIRKPLPLKKLRPPLHAVHRVTRFYPSPSLAMNRREYAAVLVTGVKHPP